MSFFDIYDRINQRAYQAFNVASDAAYMLRNINPILESNSKYKDIHSGERCFITATGPSLKNIDEKYINLLSNEIVFGVNSLYKSSVVKNICPKYYAMVDNLFWGRLSGEFENVYDFYSKSPPTFITDIRARNFIPDGADSILIYAKHYPIDKVRYDFSKNISITMNVVGFSILAAMYMGFKEIYLLGCDYNLFCSPKNNHSYDDTEESAQHDPHNLAFYLKYYHLTTEFHYLIARTAKADDIFIANMTDGSLLDAYPRRRISDVLR